MDSLARLSNNYRIIIYFKYEQANFIKFTNNYRQIVNIPKTELCEMLKSFQTHPLFTHLVPIAQKVAPDLVHPCPYNVIMN